MNELDVQARLEPDHRLKRSDRGQSTAEYALLILGVATGAIGELFDKVIGWVSNKVG